MAAAIDDTSGPNPGSACAARSRSHSSGTAARSRQSAHFTRTVQATPDMRTTYPRIATWNDVETEATKSIPDSTSASERSRSLRIDASLKTVVKRRRCSIVFRSVWLP